MSNKEKKVLASSIILLAALFLASVNKLAEIVVMVLILCAFCAWLFYGSTPGE